MLKAETRNTRSAVQSFADVKAPCCVLKADGKTRITYSMYGLSEAPTVIALEFYNYKGEWKVAAAGRSFYSGLPTLCESFGIVATE